ncbi:potassium transporter TrkG [Bacillus sp. FSL K6-3431]|uniref:potassium transporter TrkG n=1 Tax=Bacillus sp. FSL K6-3431 TaxID=2921500 RepID=UPI004046F30D
MDGERDLRQLPSLNFAFNNAGFALWPDKLSQYVGDPMVNLTITSFIIIGGIGYTVLSDMWYSKKI